MLKKAPKKAFRAREVANYLSNHNNFKSHAKRIGMNDIRKIKALKAPQVIDMREDPELQNRVWGLYHAISITFGYTAAYKIFENTSGRALIRLVQQVQIVGPMK